jgi:hypothetical protein
MGFLKQKLKNREDQVSKQAYRDAQAADGGLG